MTADSLGELTEASIFRGIGSPYIVPDAHRRADRQNGNERYQ
jgi:hypothetical protein